MISKSDLKKQFNQISNMSKVNFKTKLSYDFKTSDNDSVARSVDRDPKFPAIEKIVSASSATVELAPLHKTTLVAQSVGVDMTITVVPVEPEIGDKLIIMLANDGTARTVTFGSGFNASATVVGTINKTITVSFVYDGSRFVETGRSAAVTIS